MAFISENSSGPFCWPRPGPGIRSLAIRRCPFLTGSLRLGGTLGEGSLSGGLKLKWEEAGPFMWWSWAFFEELFVSRKPNSGQR